jgi:putative two-component system response regulator
MNDDLHDARILVVDDEPANTVLLDRILRSVGYADVTRTNEPAEAWEMFQGALRNGAPHDLVCTDLHMPGMSGLEVIERITAAAPAGEFLPVLVLTADLHPDAEREALARGAMDFLTKPFRKEQIRLRVANLLRTRQLHRRLRDHADRLEETVRQRTAELEATHLDVLDRLAAAAEYRDHATGEHAQRVGILSARLAERVGMPEAEVELLRRAAPLHDVGKIGIPDRILLKPGSLTETEFAQMQQHVIVGARLLANGRSKLIAMAEHVALYHHERWDGSGYPRGLAGDAIPLVGQIVALADVFDTLVNERPYKAAWPLEAAVAEIRRQRGRWFSPRLVDLFLRIVEEQPDLAHDLELARDFYRD